MYGRYYFAGLFVLASLSAQGQVLRSKRCNRLQKVSLPPRRSRQLLKKEKLDF